MIIYKTSKAPFIITIIFGITFTILYSINSNFLKKMISSPAKELIFYNIALIFIFAILPSYYKDKYAKSKSHDVAVKSI